MDFDSGSLFAELIVSGIGFVLFVYGKKQDRWPHLVSGLLMMVYPYFVSSVSMLVVPAACICLALWYAVRLGW
jgi:hypothetical protein